MESSQSKDLSCFKFATQPARRDTSFDPSGELHKVVEATGNWSGCERYLQKLIHRMTHF